MAKRASKKVKKAEKSARKKRLAQKKSAKKTPKKQAKKSTKKATKKAATKGSLAKSAAGSPSKKDKAKRLRAASQKAAREKAPQESRLKVSKQKKKPRREGGKPSSKEAGSKPSAPPKPAVETLPSQHLFAKVLARVHAICSALAVEDGWSAKVDNSRVVVEPPRDAAHGDMATNAAMVLAKDARTNPRDLAEKIAAKLRVDNLIASVDVAGPGFINLTLKASVWWEALRTVLREGDIYGRSRIGAAEKINVEYVSANPTGPMHVGHCRGAVFGDALASLLAFTGYDVTREYYINDAGAQVDVLARSAYSRYRESLSEEAFDGLYPGDYLKSVAHDLVEKHGEALLHLSEAKWLPKVRAKAIMMMMKMIKGDLKKLNIKHDVFFSERSLIKRGADKVAATIDYLRAKGDVYEGRLPPPKGGPIEDYEDREQTLFRATAYGDDVDRPLKKSDGGYTYFASDIAYHKTKFDRGFLNMVDVWGADHGGYIKRMQAAVKAVTEGKAVLDVKIVQLVKLLRNGEPVKMSKRSGDFVTLREVVEEVGKDAVRFMMLFRKNDAVLDFDLAKVIEQSKENAVFYVQYGHARGHSIFRNARKVLPDLPKKSSARAVFLKDAPMELLTDPAELSLLRRLAVYPRMIEASAVAHEPHRIAFYLYDLASEFHGLWHLPHLRIIVTDDAEITKARLALVQGVVSVLASGLAVLGVGAPKSM